jgi:hypothetical protein
MGDRAYRAAATAAKSGKFDLYPSGAASVPINSDYGNAQGLPPDPKLGSLAPRPSIARAVRTKREI